VKRRLGERPFWSPAHGVDRSAGYHPPAVSIGPERAVAGGRPRGGELCRAWTDPHAHMPDYQPVGAADVSSLAWVVPSKAEAQRATKALLESLDGPGLPVSLWEAELKRAIDDSAKQHAAAPQKQGSTQSSSAGRTPRPTQYTLRLTQKMTAVLLGSANSRDHVRCVYDRPSLRGTFIGTDARTTVEVVEVRDGWLRFAPQPDDTRECWVRERAADGVWEVAAAQTAASRSTEFAIRTGLRMLGFFLERDEGACEMMMGATTDFLEDLPPMALFDADAGGQTVGEAGVHRMLTMLTDWLEARSMAGVAGCAELLAKLTVARGSLQSILRLAQLFSQKPSIITPEVIAQVQKLSVVESFEHPVRSFFEPIPGSTAQLLVLWEQSVFAVIRKEKAELRNKEEMESAIAVAQTALAEGDTDAARLIVAAQLSEKGFSKVV
jgi:hypothetical protein